METLNDTRDKYTWRWQLIYMYIVTNLNDIVGKSTSRWLQIHMKMIANTHHRHVDLNYQLPECAEKQTLFNDNASNSSFNFLHPICEDSLPYMCHQFVASVFGHQHFVSIHDYLLFLVVTRLEYILTLTTNKGNFFLDPLCAVHLEVSRQFVASVFGIHL